MRVQDSKSNLEIVTAFEGSTKEPNSKGLRERKNRREEAKKKSKQDLSNSRSYGDSGEIYGTEIGFFV